MKTFAEILKSLPTVAHLDRVELTDHEGAEHRIENKPGQAGSLAVYHAIAKGRDYIDAEAAKLGLELYAEHTADAEANPGKHPNIDRLLRLIEANGRLMLKFFDHT